jgi:hypothetical protein
MAWSPASPTMKSTHTKPSSHNESTGGTRFPLGRGLGGERTRVRRTNHCFLAFKVTSPEAQRTPRADSDLSRIAPTCSVLCSISRLPVSVSLYVHPANATSRCDGEGRRLAGRGGLATGVRRARPAGGVQAGAKGEPRLVRVRFVACVCQYHARRSENKAKPTCTLLQFPQHRKRVLMNGYTSDDGDHHDLTGIEE